jgi:hypothetical protein
VTFPLLLYLGISILIPRFQYKYFGIVVLAVFLAIIILHINKFLHETKQVYNGESFEKSFGVFLILIAFLILIFNLYEIYELKNKS